MDPPDENDVGARVRAAREFARLDPDDLAERLRAAGFRFSRSTLDRVEADKRHLDVREAQVIAKECRVPLTFLVRGWWAPPDLPERVAALEEKLTQGAGERDALRRTLVTIGTLLQDRLGIDVEEASAPGPESADEADHPDAGDQPAP